MHVCDCGAGVIGDLGQGQVVSGHETDRTLGDQALDDRAGADAPIVRIGAVKELIEQEEERTRVPRQLDELANAGDLGVKAGFSILQ